MAHFKKVMKYKRLLILPIVMGCLAAVYVGYQTLARKPKLEVIEVRNGKNGPVVRVRIINDTWKSFTYFGRPPNSVAASLRDGGQTFHLYDPWLLEFSCSREDNYTLKPGEMVELDSFPLHLFPLDTLSNPVSIGVHLTQGTATELHDDMIRSGIVKIAIHEFRTYLNPKAQMYEPVWSEPFMLPAPAKAEVVSGR